MRYTNQVLLLLIRITEADLRSTPCIYMDYEGSWSQTIGLYGYRPKSVTTYFERTLTFNFYLLNHAIDVYCMHVFVQCPWEFRCTLHV